MSKIFDFFEKKLERKISRMNIQDLIIQMSNKEYYFPFNIWRFVFDRNSIYGGKQISWFAARQAEKINSIKDFEYLKRTILSSDNVQKRNAYFCVGNLSKNLKNKDIFDFLMSRIKVEADEDIQTTILTSVIKIEKESDYDLQSIFDLLENGNINLKTIAATSLQNSKNQIVEDKLLTSLQNEKNKLLHQMIAATLRDIGTIKSLPFLELKLKTEKGTDYKYFIETAINEIKERNKYCG